jgi:hypothetical protein
MQKSDLQSEYNQCEKPAPNNGMQRTRAAAFLSCTLNGRSPLMPGVRH